MKKFLLIILAILSLSYGQEIDCPSEGISYLPHPDCTLYIICVNGQGIEEECPRPLYFNPEQERCDFPENVPECVGGTRPPIAINSTTTTTTLEPTEEPSIPTTTEISTNATSSTPPATEEPTVLPNATTTELPPPSIVTQCGQTLEADSGTIQYKLGQIYDAGELCAFIIRVPNHSYIHFQLESHGINNYSDPNAITIISYDSNIQKDTIHLGPPNANSDAYALGNIAVVIFKTNGNSTLGLGFRVVFEGMGAIVNNVPGLDFVFNNRTNSPLEVPFWDELNGELSRNFIVLTDNAKLITNPGSFLHLSVGEDFVDGEEACLDYFWIYSFQGDDVNSEALFCDEDRDRTNFETRGLFIIVFRKWPETPSAKGTLMWEKVESEN
ncbi:unnamed protein product [Orchesella dallaii]|uniref:Chitin-binding type-2 domain-containing protein n=1 Tax=Orchesella dallaii TaxID=48710 RepID=A0ABP1RM41_9HEXA